MGHEALAELLAEPAFWVALTPTDGGHSHAYERTSMRPHPLGPHALAKICAQMPDCDLSEEDLLADIKECPDLYFCDHVEVCRSRGILPLSETSWRRSCLSS